MIWISAALLIPALACADSTDLLDRVRAKLTADVRRMPKYVCREHIERKTFYRERRGGSNCNVRGTRLATSDRAKLDVILSEERELFSWPGQHRFETRLPAELLGGGFSGNGDFANFRMDVFGLQGVAIKLAEECGSDCLRFTYDVPVRMSRYFMHTERGIVNLGYHGTFDVNPRSAEVLTMIVRGTDLNNVIPGACETDIEMSYARAASDRGDFMIPAVTKRSFLRTDGAYFANEQKYGECREYTAESVIRFEDDAPQPKAPAIRPAGPMPDTMLEVRWNANIDSQKIFAGDSVEAALTRSVSDTAGGTIPAGTILRGHLTQVEHNWWPRQRVIIALRLETIVIKGSEIPINVEPIGLRDAGGRALFVLPGSRAVLDRKSVSRWRVGE